MKLPYRQRGRLVICIVAAVLCAMLVSILFYAQLGPGMIQRTQDLGSLVLHVTNHENAANGVSPLLRTSRKGGQYFPGTTIGGVGDYEIGGVTYLEVVKYNIVYPAIGSQSDVSIELFWGNLKQENGDIFLVVWSGSLDRLDVSVELPPEIERRRELEAYLGEINARNGIEIQYLRVYGGEKE